MKKYFVGGFLIFMAQIVMAVTDCNLHPCRYVRAGATGAGDGRDWANAYPALPLNLVRGETYFVAGGLYSGRTFNTPVSGTALITIKGATLADHGVNTGWSNAYSVENTQATWTSGVEFNTSYWVFDGSVGPTWSKDPSQYGFAFTIMRYPIAVYNLTTVISDVVLSHITAKAPTGDVEKIFLATNNETKAVHRVTFSHCLVDGWSNAMWATSAGLSMDDWLVEYNVILNGFSSAANHGEDLNNNYSFLNRLTIRNNWFEGRSVGTASITCLNNPCGPYYIYGNVFKNMSGGDGIITGVHYPLSGAIYNNTFDQVDNGYGNGLWIGHDVSANVYNNLVYNSVAGIGANFTGKMDYNAYFNTTNTPTEAHGQVGSGSPFVNEAGNDLRLLKASSAGMILSAPYNIDVVGNVRGGDGTWDRGALEFIGNSPVLAAPKNLRILGTL